MDVVSYGVYSPSPSVLLTSPPPSWTPLEGALCFPFNCCFCQTVVGVRGFELQASPAVWGLTVLVGLMKAERAEAPVKMLPHTPVTEKQYHLILQHASIQGPGQWIRG